MTRTASSPPHPGSAPSPARSSSAASATPAGSTPRRGPRLHRPGAVAGLLRHLRPTRRPHQTRRRPAARGAVHERQPSPTARPHPRGEVPPTDGRRRQAPQLRALPHRHHAAHPRSPPAGATRRPTSSATSTARDRPPHEARAIIAERYTDPRRHSAAPAPPHRDGPAKQGVATRSIDRPVHHHARRPRSRLTSLRNSTALSSSARPSRPASARWGCTITGSRPGRRTTTPCASGSTAPCSRSSTGRTSTAVVSRTSPARPVASGLGHRLQHRASEQR